MEEKIIFMGLVIIVLLTIVVLYLIVNDKNDTKARMVSKFMALATPCLLALIIVLGIFVTGITKTIKKVEYVDTNETVGMQEQYEMYKRDLDRNYEVLMDTVDKKMNIGLSILGIAVTVWVGLNIYNVLKREDLEKIVQETDKIKKNIEKYDEKIISYEIILSDQEELVKKRIEEIEKSIEVSNVNSIINRIDLAIYQAKDIHSKIIIEGQGNIEELCKLLNYFQNKLLFISKEVDKLEAFFKADNYSIIIGRIAMTIKLINEFIEDIQYPIKINKSVEIFVNSNELRDFKKIIIVAIKLEEIASSKENRMKYQIEEKYYNQIKVCLEEMGKITKEYKDNYEKNYLLVGLDEIKNIIDNYILGKEL